MRTIRWIQFGSPDIAPDAADDQAERTAQVHRVLPRVAQFHNNNSSLEHLGGPRKECFCEDGQPWRRGMMIASILVACIQH